MSTHAIPARKPRIAIMGEFSAGKSTLTNLLIGSDPLPVKVTATQLPPVWIAYGDDDPYREDLEGNTHPVDLKRLSEIPLNQTRVIHIFLKSEILEICDLIDMPGISDPNMSSDVWERVIEDADGVLWCTHATQAWRQSEAAVWKSLSPELFTKSFLLLTRFDKLLTEHDRQRVVKRVSRETQGLFAALFPISLTNAIAAKDDRGLWELSGAEEFAQDLVDLVQDLATDIENQPAPAPEPLVENTEPAPEPAMPDNVLRLDGAILPAPGSLPSVSPARVKVAPSARNLRRPERPERSDNPPAWAEAALGAGNDTQPTPLMPADIPDQS